MELIATAIPDVKVIKPCVFEDERGYFYETFRKDRLAELGIVAEFVQDNQSLSGKHILRGLHFQEPPHAQGKLVRVIQGAVLDVAVDIRKNSPSWGTVGCATSGCSEQTHDVDSGRVCPWIPDPGRANHFFVQVHGLL